MDPRRFSQNLNTYLKQIESQAGKSIVFHADAGLPSYAAYRPTQNSNIEILIGNEFNGDEATIAHEATHAYLALVKGFPRVSPKGAVPINEGRRVENAISAFEDAIVNKLISLQGFSTEAELKVVVAEIKKYGHKYFEIRAGHFGLNEGTQIVSVHFYLLGQLRHVSMSAMTRQSVSATLRKIEDDYPAEAKRSKNIFRKVNNHNLNSKPGYEKALNIVLEEFELTDIAEIVYINA